MKLTGWAPLHTLHGLDVCTNSFFYAVYFIIIIIIVIIIIIIIIITAVLYSACSR